MYLWPLTPLTWALHSLSKETLEQPEAVLADCGFGVGVNVEGVRNTWSSLLPLRNPYTYRDIDPGRRPRAWRFRHADLREETNTFREHFKQLTETRVFGLDRHLLKTSARVIRERRGSWPSRRKQRQTRAASAIHTGAVIGQLECTAFVEV